MLESVLSEFQQVIDTLIADGWFPVFFLFASQKTWEQTLLDDWLKNHPASAYQIVGEQDPRAVKAAIAQCDVAFGVAYHFVIFALTTGVPVRALYGGRYYSNKMKGALRFFGLEEWAFPYESVECQALVSSLEKLAGDTALPDQLRERSVVVEASHRDVVSKYVQLPT